MRKQRNFRPTADGLESRDVPARLGLAARMAQMAQASFRARLNTPFAQTFRFAPIGNTTAQLSFTRTAPTPATGPFGNGLGLNRQNAGTNGSGNGSALNQNGTGSLLGSNANSGLLASLNNPNLGFLNGLNLAGNTTTPILTTGANAGFTFNNGGVSFTDGRTGIFNNGFVSFV